MFVGVTVAVSVCVGVTVSVGVIVGVFAALREAVRRAVAALDCRALGSDEIRAGAGTSDVPAHHSSERVAFLQYTSDSGGTQKGIAQKHGKVLRYIDAKAIATPFGADDVVVVWPPLCKKAQPENREKYLREFVSAGRTSIGSD